MKRKIFLLNVFFLLLLLPLIYVQLKPTRIIPDGIKSNKASYFDFSKHVPLIFEFSKSLLEDFEKYLGTPHRTFHGCKDQVFLHIKLSDQNGNQYHLFFLDTKSKPCIVKSGNHYFRIERSSNELRNYIKQIAYGKNTP